MSITKEIFGVIHDNVTVTKYTISGKSGLTVSVLDYGATLQSLLFDGKDMLIGYPDAVSYAEGGVYCGAVVGRFANRIAGAKFTLNDITYHLTPNWKGEHHIHGGISGFSKKMWTMKEIDETTLSASLFSPDGEEGYPGNLHLTVTYSVEENNTLKIQYHAETDKDTVANLISHGYFNLNGDDGKNIFDTTIQVFSDAYLTTDAIRMPVGLNKVDGTPFDLREPKLLGDIILSEHPMIVPYKGLDHCFALGEEQGTYRRAARAESKSSGIAVTCYTDMPGVQIYTPRIFDSKRVGKHGPFVEYQAFCMETENFPDAPNHPDFPSCVIKAEKPFRAVTAYTFEKVN